MEGDEGLSGSGPAQPVRAVRRRAFLGSLAMCLVLASALGLAYWASARPASRAPGYQAWIAPVGPPRVVQSSADGVPGIAYTVGVSRSGFAVAAAGLPGEVSGAFLLAALDQLGVAPDQVQVERALVTATRPDGSTYSGITVSFLLPDGYGASIDLSLDGSVRWYSPARKDLPADPAAGQSWTVDGMVNLETPFTETSAIEAAPASALGHPCLDVTSTYQVQDGSTAPTQRTVRWCLGEGDVSSRDAAGGTFVAVPPDQAAWTDPVATAPADLPAMTTLAFPFLQGRVSLRPTVAGGAVVMVNDTTGDVVAVDVGASTPSTTGGAPLMGVTWVQHPGGDVLGITATDDRLIVTTSARKVMALDFAGNLRWIASTPDVASGSPVVLGDVVAVSSLDGTVRAFDLASGRERWTTRLSDVITAAPVIAGATLVAQDASGLLAATKVGGAVAWKQRIAPAQGPMAGLADGTVLVQQPSGMLVAIGPDGARRWSRSHIGVFTGQAQLLGSVVLASTDEGLFGLRVSDGSTAWSRPDLAEADILPDGTLLVDDHAWRVDAAGSVTDLGSITAPDGVVLGRTHLLGYGNSVIAVMGNGSVTRLGGGDG